MSIQKQIEFYFSDSNFRNDKFLKEKAAEDGEGFVSIDVLLTFNKLKALTTDVAEIAKSVADSKTVVVSEDGLRLRRANALPEENDSKEKTLYVKGFPEGDEGADVTIESVTEQFSTYGNILMVRLRKDHVTRAFKGGCFIEYDSVDAVNKAIADSHDAEGQVTLKYKDTPFLCVMSLVQWLANKANKKSKRKGADTTPGEKRKRDDDQGDEAKVEVAAGPVEFITGQIVKITNVPAEATLFEIKDKFKTITEVRYVDFEVGETTAHVRLSNPEAAAKAMAAIGAGMKLLDAEGEANVEAALLEGDEETAYWEKISKNQANHGGPKHRKGGRGGGKGGKGGRGFKRGRR